MKKSQTIKIICCLVVIIICFIFSIKTIIKSKKGNIEITENEVLKDTTVGDLAFSNAEIYTSDDTSNFRAIVTNKSDKEFHINRLFVVFTVDENTQKVQSISDTNLKPNESRVIKIILDNDVSEASKIEYIIE